MLLFSWFGRRFSWKKAFVAFLGALVVSIGVVIVRNERLPSAPDVKGATYLLDGERITLTGIYTYFGNEAAGDLNGDGKDDVAFLFVAQPGGSGSFYYVAVALRDGGGYRGTNAVFLGDRIAPQTIGIKDGAVVVNYADRRAGEPYSVRPSVGISKYFHVRNGSLIEIK
ncbi:MAG: hypothetical protein IT406_00835 [Candidatus Yanofskybacteria bacterium]|nr:hypothetical protein [Candidatus Yanofskybacteria bacterium]